jgi:CheY-like chemotaxis protein
MHGGSVTARSEGLDRGSEFIVRLPLCKTGDVARPPRPEASPTRRRRILVVDDNRDAAMTLALALRLKGHDVTTASDGFEAVKLAEAERPDTILMDVGMPRMNGYDATRRIRETAWGKQILIVALTGWGQPDDLRASSEAGCSAHLVKPVNFALLERLFQSASHVG